MPCQWSDPFSCVTSAVGSSVIDATVPSAWNAICTSFAKAAQEVLAAFAHAFTTIPSVSPASAGIGRVYGISLGLAGIVAVLLMLGQAVRTALTADGSALAQALSGGAKAVLAWITTAAVATAALAASNDITGWIVASTVKSQGSLAVRLGRIVNWAQVDGSAGSQGSAGQALISASLLLIIALAGIVLVIVLWFELLLRNAAIAILIAVSPIPAAGQMTETTRVWWQRTCSAAVQLIIMKPVIALVFAVGFGMSGNSKGVEAVLEGLLVLVLAVFCWPVIARFFTFATIQSSSSGLATALGFAAGRLSGGGGRTAGVDPSQWSRGAENRTMAAHGDASGAGGAEGAGAGAGTPAPAGGGAGRAAGGSSGGTGAAVLGGIGFALDLAQRAGSALAGRMEQTAGHAGMHGAYPYSTVGGYRAGPGRSRPGRRPGGSPGPGQETPPRDPAPETEREDQSPRPPEPPLPTGPDEQPTDPRTDPRTGPRPDDDTETDDTETRDQP